MRHRKSWKQSVAGRASRSKGPEAEEDSKKKKKENRVPGTMWARGEERRGL
jgi:hypothetical protein